MKLGAKWLAATLAVAAMLCGPAQAQVVDAATTNGSAVIATGNTFQTVLAAVVPPAIRRSLTIQNNNASDACWIYIGSGTAAQGTSISLPAGQVYARYFPYIPSDAIQATCATSASTLYIDTQ